MSLQIDKFTEGIVTLETAKLAKEKGYQEEELHYYFNKELLQHPNRLYYNFNQGNPPLNQYSAPYQSFLQKWLREEHKIFICIDAMFEAETWCVTVAHLWVNDEADMFIDGFETYEEALEVGLEEALKLV